MCSTFYWLKEYSHHELIVWTHQNRCTTQNIRILCMSFAKQFLQMAKLLELSHWDNTFPLRLWTWTIKLLVSCKPGYVPPTPTQYIKYSSSEPNFMKALEIIWVLSVLLLMPPCFTSLFQSLSWYLYSTSPDLKFRLPQTTVENPLFFQIICLQF